MPTVTVHGYDLFYTHRRGGSPPVVLIHGAGGNHLLWPPNLRRMDGLAVYALDLPGHGRSGGAGYETIDGYAGAVAAFLHALDLPPAVLVGHSMGGAIVQAVALTAPARVAGLVLIATGARLRVAPAILDGLRRAPQETIQAITEWAWGPQATREQIAQGQEAMENTDPEVLWMDFKACDQFGLEPQVRQVAFPALVITGSEDRMTPPRLGEKLAAILPDGRFTLVEGGGHMVMLEKPSEVAKAVHEFIAELNKESKA